MFLFKNDVPIILNKISFSSSKNLVVMGQNGKITKGTLSSLNHDVK